MSPNQQLSDDELLELGATLENQLQSVESKLAALMPARRAERRTLLVKGLRFAAGLVVGVGGTLASIPTGGLSLGLAIAGFGLCAWEAYDFKQEHSADGLKEAQFQSLRVEAANLVTRLEMVRREMDSRP